MQARRCRRSKRRCVRRTSVAAELRRPDEPFGIDAAQAHFGGDRQEVENHLVGRRVALARIGGHHAADHGGESRRNAGILARRVGNILGLMIEQLLQHGPFGIRRLAGQHVIERAAERIDVAAHVDVARVLGLLGRDVIERAERRAGDRQIAERFGRDLLAPGPGRRAWRGRAGVMMMFEGLMSRWTTPAAAVCRSAVAICSV